MISSSASVVNIRMMVMMMIVLGEDALGWRGCFCPCITCITCITCILSITHSLADAINSGDAPDAHDQDGCVDDNADVDHSQSHTPLNCKCNRLRRSTLCPCYGVGDDCEVILVLIFSSLIIH